MKQSSCVFLGFVGFLVACSSGDNSVHFTQLGPFTSDDSFHPIQNGYDHTITGILLEHPDWPDWSEQLLFGLLPPGQTASVRHYGCGFFTVHVTLSNNEECYMENFDLCLDGEARVLDETTIPCAY